MSSSAREVIYCIMTDLMRDETVLLLTLHDAQMDAAVEVEMPTEAKSYAPPQVVSLSGHHR